MRSILCLSLSAIAFALVAGCGNGARTTEPPVTGMDCTSETHRCDSDGLTYQKCINGKWTNVTKCDAACDASLGCVQCAPMTTVCDGDDVKKCNADGTVGDIITTCVVCASGTCTDPCGKAAVEFSYIGCDYFPTVTSNSGLTKTSNFAVAVANPGVDPVDVTISRLGKTVSKVTVAPGDLQTIKLPWVLELKEPWDQSRKFFSTQVAGGAYKLSATAPVTAYQFNPLEFQTMPNCDPTDPLQMSCFTYTNDASLLLPITTLGNHYIAIARPTFEVQFVQSGFTQYLNGPGFISVVGAAPGRTTVTITFSAATLAGNGGVVKAYKAGATDTFSLAQGDVLQLLSDIPAMCTPDRTEDSSNANGPVTYGYCDLTKTDLTGTDITADHKIAVFAGHDCTFVPYDKWACDHLEEQMLPVSGWGKDYLAVHTQRGSTGDLWRIVSASDGNMISFDPPAVHDPVMLDKGQWVEFSSRPVGKSGNYDFEALGTGAFAVMQYMVGQGTGNASAGGDPAMALSVPIEQYRSSYIFLAPASYKQNFVNISAPAGELQMMLDGMPLGADKFVPIGAGKFVAGRVSIPAGTHTITASQPFGIEVYGLAPFTSYMYPGGLDVKSINIP